MDLKAQFMPIGEQFTTLANTVENENPVQLGILCCKQGTSLQELSALLILLPSESAYAVCVA